MLLAALTLTGTLAMGKTKERFVLQSKNYEFQDLKSSCAVEIEHSFGTIKFIDCEPGQVRVEVKVTTTETDETFIKDMRFMNPIEEVEVNKSGNRIIIENKNQRNENGFNRSRKGKRGYSGSRLKSEKDWSVDITVYMPAEMSINLEAAFCDITMSENNQDLVVDMGIPEDQFPREVESISISMRAPTVVYLHDEADGSVLHKDYSEENFIFEYTDIPWNRREPFRIILDLLPSEISADVTVKYAGSNEGVYYQLVSSDGKVSVKPATRTTVVFNGISDGFREIRYAGFPDDGDAVVDVAPDRWD